MRKVYKFQIILFSTFFLIQSSPAGVYERQSLSKMVDKSVLIVEGRVDKTQSRWNDQKTMIYTDIQISIDNVIKGGDAGRMVVVRLIGGRVGDTAVFVLGRPSLHAGERVLLMLKENSHSYLSQFIGATEATNLGKSYRIVGAGQGKFNIAEDSQGQEVVIQDTADMNFISNVSTKELKELSRTTLGKFKKRIEVISNIDEK